jgi:hypothetical protein
MAFVLPRTRTATLLYVLLLQASKSHDEHSNLAYSPAVAGRLEGDLEGTILSVCLTRRQMQTFHAGNDFRAGCGKCCSPCRWRGPDWWVDTTLVPWFVDEGMEAAGYTA